jgi:tripartite-type tricarboxylate transporter receptor subunit TctC
VYQELSTMLKSQEVRERFLAQGALASGMAPDEFVSFIKVEMEKWAKVAKFANIRLD